MRFAHRAWLPLFALTWIVADPAQAVAGMPSLTLTDAASLRLQSISFFLSAFLVSSFLVRWIWNSLRSDFPRLPRLSYPRALALVGLWGLLFLLVLTMISGARELMTPGAWKKDGLTYALDDGTKSPGPTEGERRNKLTGLYASLSAYAMQHDGSFPASDTAIPLDTWKTPHVSGMRYVYRPGGKVADTGRVVACEPELFSDGRLALFANGEIRRMTSDELAPLFVSEGR